MTENLDKLPETKRKTREAIEKLQKSEKNTEYMLKVCIIGSDWDLREKLILSYTGAVADPVNRTLGVEISTLKIIVKDTVIKLILVNTAGQEFFGKLRPNYYRNSSACIIIFDKSDRKSFDAVPDWLEEFRRHTVTPKTKYTWVKGYKEVIKEVSSIPIAILGINTKEEDVSSDECIALAELSDLPYFETSAPKFENAKEIVEYLARKVIKL